MKINSTLPIGVFDSGLGGLTVVNELSRQLPNEKIIYVGDTARVPYGVKSPETIRRYALQIGFYLLRKRVKMIVVACNSASAVALSALKKFPIPVIGVIEPGSKAASLLNKGGKIGVIGTQATVSSQAYVKTLKSLNRKAKVVQKACPLFVPLVEEGRTTGAIAQMIAREYLQDFKKAKVQTLVLGCTHYPLLKPVIRGAMGKSVTLVDSAKETAKETKRRLISLGLAYQGKRKGRPEIFVTDQPKEFNRVGARFLGRPAGRAKRLNLDGM